MYFISCTYTVFILLHVYSVFILFTNHGMNVLRYFLTRHVFLHSYPASYHFKQWRISTLAWTAKNCFITESLQFPCIFLLSCVLLLRVLTFHSIVPYHAKHLKYLHQNMLECHNKHTAIFLGIDTRLYMSYPINFLEIELSPSILPYQYSLDFAFTCSPFLIN